MNGWQRSRHIYITTVDDARMDVFVLLSLFFAFVLCDNQTQTREGVLERTATGVPQGREHRHAHAHTATITLFRGTVFSGVDFAKHQVSRRQQRRRALLSVAHASRSRFTFCFVVSTSVSDSTTQNRRIVRHADNRACDVRVRRCTTDRLLSSVVRSSTHTTAFAAIISRFSKR